MQNSSMAISFGTVGSLPLAKNALHSTTSRTKECYKTSLDPLAGGRLGTRLVKALMRMRILNTYSAIEHAPTGGAIYIQVNEKKFRNVICDGS